MRPTYVEVNLKQLRLNLEAIRKWVAPAAILVMVKANAYGHGVEGVAPYLEPFVDYLGVAILEEGIQLRAMGIKKPVLVMGGALPGQIPEYLEYDLTLTASSEDLLAAGDKAAMQVGKRLRVHLKIDTGMERVGVRDTDARPFIEASLAFRHVEIEGIYSHLANSELKDRSFSRLQLERFQKVLTIYDELGAERPRIRHLCNSGGILQFPEGHLDMVRPGIMLYGVYPGTEVDRQVLVKPALTWRSQVVYSKITPPGRPVSYGSLWEPGSPTRIVTIPCGYADGYFRRMTGLPQVIIKGKRYSQVGRICMDQFMVDVGQDDIKVGEPVTLLGEGITVEELGEWAGTNNYEPLTNISGRVPRVYIMG